MALLKNGLNFCFVLIFFLRAYSVIRGENVTWIRIKFGVILPVDDDRPFSIQKCFSAIKHTFLSPRVKSLLPHVNFSAYSGNSKCNSIAAPLAAFGLMDVEKVHVIFGPVCDYSLAPVARYSPYWNVPVITPGGMAMDFGKGRMSNTSEFRLLTRVGINFDDLALVTHKVLKTFGWEQVKILYSSDGYSEVSTKFCYLAVSAIVQYFKRMGIETDEHTFEQDEEDDDMTKLLLKHIGNEHTVIILCNSPDSVRELMIIAHQLNFDNGEYVFINLDPFGSKRMLETPWLRASESEDRNKMAMKAFESLLIITLNQPRGEDYMRFAHAVRSRANAFFNETVFDSAEDVNIYAALFHDAVLLYAHALNETLTTGFTASDGDVITNNMRNKTIQGLSGKFIINKKGDRSMDFSLLDMNPSDGKFAEVGSYFGSNRTFRLRRGVKIHWGGANPYSVPNGTLTCGYDNALCPEPEAFPSYGIILISIFIVTCITIFVSWFFCKENQRKKSRRNLHWLMKWEDILFEAIDRRRFERKNSILAGKYANTMRGSLSSLLTCDSTSAVSHEDIMTKIGSYKGTRVSIRKVGKPISMTKELSKHLEIMKNLQDDHIVRFIGMCIDPPNVCIVTQFCHKRKLKDLLADSRVNLDIMFKYSLIQDIVMGMVYLHGSDINCHGNLNTMNCVVDSRFMLKITNFGLHFILNESYDPDDPSSPGYQDQLWMAPELLRSGTKQRPLCGSQKGDMYSFAIICQEILYRRGPFWIEDGCLSVQEIIKLVKKGDIPHTRPTLINTNLSQDGFNAELVQLVARCWVENPIKRPDFHNLKFQLKRCISSSGKVSGTSLLDNILSRLEQYAQNLEILVEEKTKDYLDQKRRAEEILYMLLPRSVAEQLMVGGRVKAEKFESVTICFCDICGFTALSAASSPMEVVTMLNDLYTKFDEVIDTFDVYKVETIGDAYMVVSGLNQNANSKNAAEISRMALNLRDVTKSFQIGHMPTERIKLRTGIHYGPVCAGVVGRKMPRYCLFGDTVNTTITIQTLAEPMTIHVSNPTKVILEDSDEFDLKERGVVFLPGKGNMTTWWLAGMKVIERPKWRLDDDSS